MKRLVIIVEGKTEQEFVGTTMSPFLAENGIYDVRAIPIHTSKNQRGGFVNYQHLRNDITRSLQSAKNDFVVTTFVDFFRIPDVPGKDKWHNISNDAEKVEMMQQCIDLDIADRRFFSYIQLHEFEALLFSDNKGFEKYMPNDVSERTKTIIDKYANPEDINSGADTAPSKRLLKIYPQYNKVLDGNIITLEIGIDKIINKCPRFKKWIERIIEECNHA